MVALSILLKNRGSAPREVTRPTENVPFCRPGDPTERVYQRNPPSKQDLSRAFFPVAAMSVLLLGAFAACSTIAPRWRGAALIEDFEVDTRWDIDNSGNVGSIEYSTRYATHGSYCMELMFSDNRRHKTVCRKKTDQDLASARHFWIDVFNPNINPGMMIGLAFQTENRTTIELLPKEFGPGWTRNLLFEVSPQSIKKPGTMKQWESMCGHVHQLRIYVFPGENQQGKLYLDNLRCDKNDRRGKPDPGP